VASTIKNLEVPLPIKGLDTDTAHGAPGYARILHNAYMASPVELLVRRGWREGVGWYNTIGGTKTNVWPYSVTTYETPFATTSLVNLCELSTGYPGAYQALGVGGAFGGTDRTVYVTWSQKTFSGSVALAASGTGHRLYGPGAIYNGTLYSCGEVTAGGSSLLCVWGGANGTTHTSGGVTIGNGAVGGTFSSAPAASKAGMFLRVTGGATGPGASYRYAYRIVEHTAGDINFQIDTPYGMGETTANVPNAVGASTTIEVRNTLNLTSNGYGASSNYPAISPACVALFRDRLFVGRGVHPNTAEDQFNKLIWSDAGYPQKFTSTNNVLVGDQGDIIMGLAVVDSRLLIFMKHSTWVLSGYDEDTFTLTQLYSDIGLLDQASLCYYNGSLIFWSHRGLFMTNGSGPPVELTRNAFGQGIRNELVAKWDSMTTGVTSIYGAVSCAVVADDLLVSIQDRRIAATTPVKVYRYNFLTRAWSTWGNTTNSSRRQPWLFTQAGRRTMAVTPYQMMEVTECFVGEDTSTIADTQADIDYTTTDTETTSIIEAEFSPSDVYLGPDGVRLKGVQIEHNCHYYNSVSSPRVAWAMTLDGDADIDATALTVGNIDARYIGNVSSPAYGKYFVTKFKETAGIEGVMFRVTFTKTATTHSAKIMKVRLLVDSATTQVGRVDNPTL
jgi:hypothetical protein